jgi:hypothetical protein
MRLRSSAKSDFFLQICEFGGKAGLHFFKYSNCKIVYISIELICFRFDSLFMNETINIAPSLINIDNI